MSEVSSSLVLQRRFVSHYMPAPFREWHDHPEPEIIAGEKHMRAGCARNYNICQKVEYRMVRRTDKVEWEYAALHGDVPETNFGEI
jgi:hypothetical protein